MRLISRSMIWVGLACILAPPQWSGPRAAETAPGQTTKPWLPEIAVEKYALPNGLTVILHEDHRAPLVAVNITYNVGSKDDPPGRSGLAHVFEHMMFEGSAHSDKNFSSPIYRYTTHANGATERDRTAYHETVTSNALERTLWLEADRMGYVLPALTQAKLDKVRDVVANERWQTLDELPLAEVAEARSRALYPPGHPYRRRIIGSPADVSAIRLEDLIEFYQRHYAPNHAFLCLAGDFDPAQARRWIARYFTAIQPGLPPAASRPDVPALAGAIAIKLTDRVRHPYAALVWPTVPANHPDEAALDVLASVLGGESRWNRLFRALLYDRQIATSVSASHPTFLLTGLFEINLFARSGQDLDEMIGLVRAEIERLKRDGPTADEVRRVKIERRKQQSLELDSVTSKARVLCQNAATNGDPLAYRTVLQRIFAVTPADVKRVARAYLGSGVIQAEVHPGPRGAVAREPEVVAQTAVQAGALWLAPRDDSFDRAVMPEVGAAPAFRPPLINRRRLSNGLEVRIVERHDLPIVRLRLVVRSGETSAPRGKDGLGVMTVNLLEEGTKSRSAQQLESDLGEIGASLSTEGTMESSTVSLTTVTRHLARALELFADAILSPAFADNEYLRLKLHRLAELEDRADNAEEIAADVMPRLLYLPAHPYARTALGTFESVRAITREEIIAFYERHYVPENAALVVVGDVRPDAIVAALEARFGHWPPGPVPQPPALPQAPWPTVVPPIYLIDHPGAAQSVISIGRPGTSIRSPDRHPLLILKDKLAGRINTNLVDGKGVSYGFLSTLDPRRGAGPFVLTGSVPTSQTKRTLVEIFNELNDLAGASPISEEELTDIRRGLLPDWIDRFETITDVATQVAYLVSHRLPDDYFAREPAHLDVVTKAEIDRLAPQFLAPWRMTILVVGDRSRLEKPLRSLPFGRTIRLLDTGGKPVQVPGSARLAPVGKADRSSKR